MSAVIARTRRRIPGLALAGALWYVPIVVTAVAIWRWGLETRAVIIVGAFVAIAFAPLPGWLWATFALSASLILRLFTSSGLLPNVLDFADFGLVYAGLAAVLLRRGIRSRPEARTLAIALLVLLFTTCMSWMLQPSDISRPFLTFALWAEPFALILLLIAEPPSRRNARMLLGWFIALVAVQLPFAVYQAVNHGLGDPVVGTLSGSGAGAHVIAGVGALAGLAVLAWGFAGSFGRAIMAVVISLPFLIGLPLLSDAKQVLFALPIAALVLAICAEGTLRKLLILVIPSLGLVLLLTLVPAGQVALTFIDQASEGQSGKLVGLQIVRGEFGTSLTSWSFGLGPANGLSRAAYLTRPEKDSALSLLELEPAPLPPRADAVAARLSGGTSFNLPESSAFGVLTDIGVIGLLAFIGLIFSVMAPLWARRRTWLAQAALAGWVMSVPLALTFDWWEQPPFMLSLAVISGLAVSAIVRPEGHRS
jgi:hypothetical protein